MTKKEIMKEIKREKRWFKNETVDEVKQVHAENIERLFDQIGRMNKAEADEYRRWSNLKREFDLKMLRKAGVIK